MITPECLIECKEKLEDKAGQVSSMDIGVLVNLLNDKSDDIRYPAFLLLKKISAISEDVYPYWDIFCDKLDSENSYQRSIGIMLLSENVKWDKNGRFNAIIKKYLDHTEDEKFITSRQTIQSIKVWIKDKPDSYQIVLDRLKAIEIETLKSTQKKLILTDIIDVFLEILSVIDIPEITDYINNALTGAILDKKSAKEIMKRMG